jgi:hypothetical protein
MMSIVVISISAPVSARRCDRSDGDALQLKRNARRVVSVPTNDVIGDAADGRSGRLSAAEMTGSFNKIDHLGGSMGRQRVMGETRPG